MIYFIQVVIYTGLMLLLYLSMLRDKPLHKFNRAYLLTAAMLPLLLPFIQLPQALRPQTESKVITGMLPELVVGINNTTGAASLPIWLVAIVMLYAITALIIALMKIRQYIQLRRLINYSTKEHHNQYTLLKHTGYGPGSWGRYILLPDGDVDEAIIRHEQQHVQLHHSRDMVFINIVQCLAWCNPFIHLVKKELVQVHEFQADAATVFEHEDYSKLLLSTVFGTCTLPLTHSFINHPIKRRIMMLQKNKTRAGKRGLLAAAVVVAMAGGIVVLQSCQQKKEEHVAAAVGEKPDETGALMYVHKMPEPDYNLSEKLASVIVYPKEAIDKGIEGKVSVKFIVDENGNLTNIKPAKDDYDPILVEAALKAVRSLPGWVPGEDVHGTRVKVWFTLPVNFQLGKDKIDGKSAAMQQIKGKQDMLVTRPYRDGDDEVYRLKVVNSSVEETDYLLHHGGITMIVADDIGSGINIQDEEAKRILKRYNN